MFNSYSIDFEISRGWLGERRQVVVCCCTLKSCDFSYLKADLIAGLFGIAFDGVGRSHSWGVDGTIVGNDESVTSIVQFQPI